MNVIPINEQSGDGEDSNIDENILCCCEYFDRDGERYHMLQCCCNCVDLDLTFDRIICCQSADKVNRIGMLLTFQDRLRIPWGGGAKQISLDTLIPVIAVPFITAIAAINVCTAIIMCLTTIIFLGYSYFCLQRTASRSRFFFIWMLSTVVYIMILFQISVPLLEILPEENYALVFLVGCTTFCWYKTKVKSLKNIVDQSLASEDDLPDIDEEQTSVLIYNEEGDDHHPNICQICRKYVPPRTFHCKTCQSCIIKHDHHNYWLNCCIGVANHRYFYAGLWFALLGFGLISNLILTSVCHPLLIFTVFGVHVLVPDDCTEVFDQYEMSLSFVIAIYSFLIEVGIFVVIIIQTYLIAKGITLTEWRKGETGNHKRILCNIKSFLFWRY